MCVNLVTKNILYRFPKDPVKCATWVEHIKRKDWQPTAYSRLCSAHFDESCYVTDPNGNKVLKEDSIPTIFAAFPKHLQVGNCVRTSSSIALALSIHVYCHIYCIIQ